MWKCVWAHACKCVRTWIGERVRERERGRARVGIVGGYFDLIATRSSGTKPLELKRSFKLQSNQTVSVYARGCVFVGLYVSIGQCVWECVWVCTHVCVRWEKWRRGRVPLVPSRFCTCGQNLCVTAWHSNHNTIRNTSSNSIWKFWNRFMKCLGKFLFENEMLHSTNFPKSHSRVSFKQLG